MSMQALDQEIESNDTHCYGLRRQPNICMSVLLLRNNRFLVRRKTFQMPSLLKSIRIPDEVDFISRSPLGNNELESIKLSQGRIGLPKP
jgi:hypothetical protein